MSRSYTVVLLVLLFLGCEAGEEAPEEASCGSQRFATVALGEALSRVRSAREFADDRERRVALADLESQIVRQIRAEPDSTVREAAWMMADNEGLQDLAEQERRRIERLLSIAPSEAVARQARAEQYTAEYRRQLSEVVKLVDPRSPKACAADLWQPLYEAALFAEAL